MLICIGQITPGTGKVALVGAPSWPLPKEIVARVKPGFGVPPDARAGDTSAAASRLRDPDKSKAIPCRRWWQFVFKAAGPAGDKVRRTGGVNPAV
jgi:hypothetical protein